MTSTWRTRLASLRARLLRPVDARSIVAFRVLFGLTMAIACTRYLARGFLHAQLIEPRLLFPYLDLLTPWPAPLLYGHVLLLIAAAICIALGLHTRLASLVFCLGFSYLELLDRSTYLNHYYLVSCLSLLLALVPTGGQVPSYVLYALRLQVAVVYLFAGLAKLQADWLLRAQPLRMWLGVHSDLPVLGPLLQQPESAFVASWLGALFDLGVVPLLLWRRTTRYTFAALALFHLSTGLLLPIGMFPWIMLSAATLLLPPDWPARWLKPHENQPIRRPGWLAPMLALHCAVQVALPTYRHLFHRDAAWSYRGFDFAWKVMVAEKAGHVRLRVRDPHDDSTVEVDQSSYLTARQQRAVAADPALIATFARFVAQRAEQQLGHQVEVYVDAFASLNGRPSVRLVDPTRDVRAGAPEEWILPLED